MFGLREQREDFIQTARDGGFIKAIRKECQTLSAAISPNWNWRGLIERPAEDPVHSTDNFLPDIVCDFMQSAGEVAGGTMVVYGGSLNDLLNGKDPRDYDGYCLTRNHPLFAMHRVERWAKREGYEVVRPRRRIRLLWKRIGIKTDSTEFDISFLHGRGDAPFLELGLARQLADDPDVSPCARSATSMIAFQSERCRIGERDQKLIFRSLKFDRDKFRHLDRWLKYAVVKYPERDVVYRNPDDAALFAPLNGRRAEVKALYDDMSRQGKAPRNFEPFRPVVPELYDRLLANMRT